MSYQTELQKTLREILKKRHGEPYASDKAANIEGMDAGQVMAWAAVELDPQNLTAFLHAIGVADSSGYTASQALRRIMGAARAHRA